MDFAFRNLPQRDATQVKLIDLAVQQDQTIARAVTIVMEDPDRAHIRVQVYPTQEAAHLPSQLMLVLRSEGKVIQSVQATDQDRYIQLGFRCPAGTAFTLRVVLADWSVEEDFVVSGSVS